MKFLISTLKLCIPPIFTLLIRKANPKHTVLTGSYKNYTSALKNSSGYASKDLLNKIISSNSKVMNGDVPYERDGILFSEYQYFMEINAAILKANITKTHNRPLRVIDFGGSLGTLYRQFKSFTHNSINLNWRIVEQDYLVKYGINNLSADGLSFMPSSLINTLKPNPDIVIFSASLQFMKDPGIYLKKMVKLRPKYIVIDRTPFHDKNYNHLSILKAGTDITGSYPCWIFGQTFLVERLSGYRLVSSWTSNEGNFFFYGGIGTYKGFLYEKK